MTAEGGELVRPTSSGANVHLRAGSGLALKGSGLVFVATRGADIHGPSRRGAGVYAGDTRHLSTYEVRPRRGRLRLRSAEALPDGALLCYDLGPLRVERRFRIDQAIADEWTIENSGRRPASFDAVITVDADFRDLFEVRRITRATRGRRQRPVADGRALRFSYAAVDGVRQRTVVTAPVEQWRISDGPAQGRLRVAIEPGARRRITSATHLAQWCGPTGGKMTTHAFDVRPGGVWDATSQGPDGRSYPNHFVWKEIEPPERIVWLYGSSKDDPHAVPTTVTLVERGATTEVTLRILFGTKEERDEKVAKYYAAQGAQQSLDQLAAYAATPAAGGRQ